MTAEEWYQAEMEQLIGRSISVALGHHMIYMHRTYERLKGHVPAALYVWLNPEIAKAIIRPEPPEGINLLRGWVVLVMQSKYGAD